MSKRLQKTTVVALVLIVLISICWEYSMRKTEPQKISEPGHYDGYTETTYSSTIRASDYLTLPDGTRLAYDLFLPAEDGVTVRGSFPALFKYTPYGRAWTVFNEQGQNNLTGLHIPWYMNAMLRVRSWLAPDGNVFDALSRTEWLKDMVKSGYAVIVVDRPGTGASFGKFSFDPARAAAETNAILNWIAGQDWSDGNIGMFGDSIQAQVQFQAASTGNPHLKAILPATTWIDNYSAVVYPGGIRNDAFAEEFARIQMIFGGDIITPVDSDEDRSLLAAALAERTQAVGLGEATGAAPSEQYRDDPAPDGGNFWIDQQALYPLFEPINRAGVPVYLINGWFDIYARDNFLIYANLSGPKRILIRPTDHHGIESASSDIDYGAEARRWFDYWLKGIDNGIMDEPPIHYSLLDNENTIVWKSAAVWPPENQKSARYYFWPGNSGSAVSVNTGNLTTSLPAAAPDFDPFPVDYATTSGVSTRWTALASAHRYPNLSANDRKAITFTTPELVQKITVVGHPVVHLWLSADVSDLDVFLYLEAVSQDGKSNYITEGSLRASHRLLAPAPFDNLGLPWHNHFRSETARIPAGEPVEIVMDLLPTAYQLEPGEFLRIRVAFADAGNFDTPILSPAPTICLFQDSQHASYLDLPILTEP